VPTTALDALVRALHDEFESGPGGTRVIGLLEDYAQRHADWREFALFAEPSYTRNLVAREAEFELMILCWKAGQESPIHNHEGQDCWMAVLEGEIEEVLYPWPTGRGPLLPRSSNVYGRGRVGFIRDEMGLHLVRPAASASVGVTLHVYSSPFEACNCYCPDTGRVTRKQLGHHSIRGQILSPGASR